MGYSRERCEMAMALAGGSADAAAALLADGTC
jgi:hypothetical protein